MSTVRIQVRRGTASQWTSVNPILAAGELGVESDTNLFKFGNGSSTWTALAYANNSDVAIGEISQDAIAAALTMGGGLTKTYNDGANTITLAVDPGYFNELAQDAINTALTPGTGITKTYDDTANQISVSVDTSVISTKSYVDSQVGSLQSTSDSTYLVAADLGQASGVASLNASGKVPSTQLDITETIQDAVGTFVTTSGNLLSATYNDAAGTFVLGSTNNPSFSSVSGDTATIGTLTTTGNAGVGGNLTITGNLTVNGTSTTVNSTNLSVDDPMIYIGDGNQSAVLDLGLVAAFNDGTYQHTGLVKDASDGVWKLFAGVTAEPGTTVDFTNATYETLKIGTLDASTAKIGSVLNSEIQRLSGVTSNVQTQLDSKANKADPTFTGVVTIPSLAITTAVTGITKSMISLANVDNTSDANKPVSTATQTQLDLKSPIASPTFTGTVTIPALVVTGSTTGITKGAVGLYYADNTSDADKPISSATATALAGKLSTATAANTYAPLASPTFTGTVLLPDETITSSMIANGAVGTADIADSAVTSAKIADGTIVSGDLADGAVTSAKIADGTIVATDIADGAITSAKILDGTIQTSDLSDNSITSAKIVDGTIVNTDISATAEIATSKISGLDTALAAKLSSTTAANTYAPLASPTFTGTVTLPVSTITSSMISDGTIVNGDISASAAIATSKIDGLDTALAAKLASATAASTYETISNVALKAPLASPALTGTPTAPTATAGTNTTQVATTAFVGTAVSNLVASAPAALDTLNELATALGNDSNFATTVTSALSLKAPLASPTFTGTVTLPAAGIVFSDGTQAKEGVPSRTPIISKTADYTLSATSERDSLIEVNSASALTVTVPSNSSVAYPVGTSIDILRVGAGAVTVAAGAGVTLNYTPGNKLRAQWSSATLFKRATDTWVLMGDLSA